MSGKRFHFDVHGFCALPLVRRAHQAVVVALAVFVVTLVALREPFHGYLGEVHITGPSTAGLDLDDAVRWLKNTEPRLAAVATPAGEISAKCEIRATYVARQPRQALLHLDELADRWLYQYLPDRLQTFRRNTLASLRTAANLARQREDAAQERLEGLRQKQVAAVLGRGQGSATQGSARNETERRREGETEGSNLVIASGRTESDKANERLQALRLSLSQLLASHTEEHPEVVSLKSQISAMERELGVSAGGLLPGATESQLIPAGGERQIRNQAPRAKSGEHFVSTEAVIAQGSESGNEEDLRLASQISTVASELSKASRERMAAEQHMTERMQELSSQPTAAQWSAGPAHVITRLGGTPRSSTLAVAGLLAIVAGVAMFRATRIGSWKPKIESVGELSSALELPVVGNLALRESDRGKKWRVITPARLRALTIAAEGIVGLAAVACLISIAIDPSLGRQVLEDPFGTLSEVIGRFGA